MSFEKIHCPICNGYRKLDGRPCLNCLGRGIVDLDERQRKIIYEINLNQRLAQIERERIEREENERLLEQERLLAEEQRKRQINSFYLWTFITLITLLLTIIFWEEIINFFLIVIKIISYIIGFFIGLALLAIASWFSKGSK